jgi:hypothetical protein
MKPLTVNHRKEETNNVQEIFRNHTRLLAGADALGSTSDCEIEGRETG